MGKSFSRPIADAAAKQEIEQMDRKLEHAVEHHEFKMVYIGIATLIAFAAAIFAAWKF
jgi:hypothetical protein